jgi:hypothetical protein
MCAAFREWWVSAASSQRSVDLSVGARRNFIGASAAGAIVAPVE